MIYFFYGENSYTTHQKVQEIWANFVKEEGSDFNALLVEGEKMSLGQFIATAMAMPLFGGRRLIVIKNFLLENQDKDCKKAVAGKLKEIDEATAVVFVEYGLPDKRESAFKILLKETDQNQYFGPPSEIEIRRFAKERLANKISDEALLALCQYVGPDLWRLENEIAKLESYMEALSKEKIVKEDIGLLIQPINSLKIFDLTDAIAQKKSERAMAILERFLKDGEDEFRIFNLIIYQLRNMLLVDEYRQTPSNQIASKTGLAPFVIQKIMPLLAKFNPKELERLYFSMHELDWQIKTGAIEPKVALPMLIVEFCKR